MSGRAAGGWRVEHLPVDAPADTGDGAAVLDACEAVFADAVGSWCPRTLGGALGPEVAAELESGSSVAHLGVRAGYRRRGLGALVLDALLADLAPLPGPVHLGTQADNTASRALYASRGFVTVESFRYPGEDRQWLLLRRPPAG